GRLLGARDLLLSGGHAGGLLRAVLRGTLAAARDRAVSRLLRGRRARGLSPVQALPPERGCPRRQAGGGDPRRMPYHRTGGGSPAAPPPFANRRGEGRAPPPPPPTPSPRPP